MKIKKPVILAICGKSASGKDTLAQFLGKYLSAQGLNIHNIVSVTTRPKRDKEQSAKDYYFINENQFFYLLHHGDLLEHTKFRNWYYGVPIEEIKPDCINIGVFNPEGLRTLEKQKYKFFVIPIYLEEKLRIRLRRSHDREGKWKLEYIRRLFADHFAFRGIKKILPRLNNGKFISMEGVSGAWKQSLQTQKVLTRWGILIEDENEQLRLGNLV